MSNKKSAAEDLFSLTIMVVVVLLMIFYFSTPLFGQQSSYKNIVAAQVVVKDSSQQLINYLKTHVSGNLPNTNVADIISYYYFDRSDGLLNQLKAATEEFFSKSSLEKDYSSWSLELIYPGKELAIESERSRTQQVLRKELSRILLPIHYTGQFVEIRLFIVTTKFVSA